MISIVMAYHNRLKQLNKTIETIKKSIFKDYEIVIVDDNSSPDEKPFFTEENIRIISLTTKNHHNPCIPFNVGFKAARGNIVMIQNPECAHNGDVLDVASKLSLTNNYYTFACYSLNQEYTTLFQNNQPLSLINKTVGGDGDIGWYNHSVYRSVGYHFCSVISKVNLNDLGGFDERYANGHGWDDNEFLTRIRRKGLNVSIINNPFVFHQFHYNSPFNPENIKQCNYTFFHNVTLRESTWKVN